MIDKNDNRFELICLAIINLGICAAVVSAIYLTRNPWLICGLCCMVSYKDDRHKRPKERKKGAE